ncbi:MAG: glutamine synthetase type III, partial [Clostridia bacterium]|nr:glutamine synthetase type III [Clostridia bacterium]
NGYDDSWLDEATKRGLVNYRTTVDCVPHFLDKKNVDMLTKYGVYTKKEIESRVEIILENYAKTVKIEARTLAYMAIKQIAPAVARYTTELSDNIAVKQAVNPKLECRFENDVLNSLSVLNDQIWEKGVNLQETVDKIKADNYIQEAVLVKDQLLPLMYDLRLVCDKAEKITEKEYWPFPGYEDLLFGVK